VQTPGPDVLGALVDQRGELGNPLDRRRRKLQPHAFGAHQRHILLHECVLRLGENAHEVVASERFQLDADRKPALELGMRSDGFET
jgi:hypothetical protein